MSTDSAPKDDIPSDSSTSFTDASTVAPQMTLDEAFIKMEEYKVKQSVLAGISEQLTQARETIEKLQGKEEILDLELATLRGTLKAGYPRALAFLATGVDKPAAPAKVVASPKVAPEPNVTEKALISLSSEQAIQVLETFQGTFSLGNFRKKVNKMFPGHHSRGVPELLRDLIEPVGDKKGPGALHRKATSTPA